MTPDAGKDVTPPTPEQKAPEQKPKGEKDEGK